ncbi:hypothetical protein [Hymenobacter negativus]|uniref:DUF4919 domain-containing protein n=1 Tax=Hymenobacter negativus TaxID=2795026 RepID=A0ABS3QDN7_9BACT|nr:hypothetical protein [Hymenobacter negativus]MBO2009343.1 hypothetical protein [Hymenobacter negativus]
MSALFSWNSLLLTGLLTASQLTAHAQVDLQTFSDATVQAVLTATMVNAIKRSNTTSRPATSAVATKRFAYTPTAVLRQQTVQQLAARLKPNNPAAANSLATGKVDYSTIYRSIVQGTSLPENDAAAALASYLITGYLIMNGVHDDNAITPSMAQGVRTQIAGMLASNSQLASPTAVAKLGEEMKLQTVLLTATWQQSIKNNNEAAFRTSTGQLFSKQYGFDMTKVRPTAKGFAPR